MRRFPLFSKYVPVATGSIYNDKICLIMAIPFSLIG